MPLSSSSSFVVVVIVPRSLKTPKLNTNGTYNRFVALAKDHPFLLEPGERRAINVITTGHNYRSIGRRSLRGQTAAVFVLGITAPA